MNACESKIKAVTFDLWETLLFEKDGWSLRRTNARCRNLAQALGRFGINISIDRLTIAFREMPSWLESVWSANKEVSHLDQIRFIVETASKGSLTLKEKLIDQLSSAYVSAFFDVPPYLNSDARKVLRWLKNREKLIGLICNTGLTPGFGLRSFLVEKGVAKYFDLIIFSDEIGVRKPDPRIFQIVPEIFKVKPCEIVHIGDNLKGDVWGAKNAGFKAMYLSTEVGRDNIAESDPSSLVSISRKTGNLGEEQIVPDKTIISLAMSIRAIEELEL